MNACFIGHRKINQTEQLVDTLKATILTLIQKGVTTFLFGSMSDFDNLSWEIVTNLQKQHPEIVRVYVRSSFQYIDNSYEKYLLKSYEKTYYPIKIEKAGKYSYVERNCEMINKADYCVFYYNKNYIPKEILPNNNNSVFAKRNSGTKYAYEYALKKKKTIINLHQQ